MTRGSIILRKKLFAKRMDCRVKPGNDGALNALGSHNSSCPALGRASTSCFSLCV